MHKLYTFVFYFSLRVSVMLIDHHKVEKRYGKKSGTQEASPFTVDLLQYIKYHPQKRNNKKEQ